MRDDDALGVQPLATVELDIVATIIAPQAERRAAGQDVRALKTLGKPRDQRLHAGPRA